MNATAVDPAAVAGLMLAISAMLSIVYTLYTGETRYLEKIIYILLAYGILLIASAYGLQAPQVTITL